MEGDYVPNASNLCLAIRCNVGNLDNSINYDTATVFRSTTDGPSDLNSPWNSSDAPTFAALCCSDTGAIERKRNILSVVKTGVGKYRDNFNYSAISDNLHRPLVLLLVETEL